MFYNYLIFNMVTLSLRILLKYCVSRCKNKEIGSFNKIISCILPWHLKQSPLSFVAKTIFLFIILVTSSVFRCKMCTFTQAVMLNW